MSKKNKATRKPSDLVKREEQVTRLAHEILSQKIEPANLTVEEAITVVSTVVKALVLANTSDDDLEDRSEMIEWVEDRLIGSLIEIAPKADSSEHPHVWFVQPQGRITEPVGILWTGSHEDDDNVSLVVGSELVKLREDVVEMQKEMEVHVVEGIDGVAIIDPGWDGSPTIVCDNPDCGKVHDIHLTVAENVFLELREKARAQGAAN